jgi:hypothetical protein
VESLLWNKRKEVIFGLLIVGSILSSVLPPPMLARGPSGALEGQIFLAPSCLFSVVLISSSVFPSVGSGNTI